MTQPERPVVYAAARRMYEHDDCDLGADWERADAAAKRGYLKLAEAALDGLVVRDENDHG